MKQVIKFLSALFLALSLLTVIGCASTKTQEATGQYFDDSVITSKIKAAILHEPTLSSAEINVETFKGVVQLSGFISSNQDADRAIEVVRTIGGVKSIKNDMRLK